MSTLAAYGRREPLRNQKITKELQELLSAIFNRLIRGGLDDFLHAVDENLGGGVFRVVARLCVPVPCGLAYANLFSDGNGGVASGVFILGILDVFERSGDVFGDDIALKDFEDKSFILGAFCGVEGDFAHFNLARDR